MGLPLGLDAALSGLQTAQRRFDLGSQSVAGPATQAAVRQATTQPSTLPPALMAFAAPSAAVTRSVAHGLRKTIRGQRATLGSLDALSLFFPDIQSLFGVPGDGQSIADTLDALSTAWQELAGAGADPGQQAAVVRNAADATDQLNTMTQGLQSMRVSADGQIAVSVEQINQNLATIHGLNQRIVRETAIGADISGLNAERDAVVDELAANMDIGYFQRADGSMAIYTGAGKLLLDGQPAELAHVAAASAEPWMTAAGGQFGPITLSTEPGTDISNSIRAGRIRGLLDLRDRAIPALQSQMDQMATGLKALVNRIANRAAGQPAAAATYTGSRVFATQAGITPTVGDVASTLILHQGTTSITAATGGAAETGYGALSLSYSTTGGQIILTAANPIFNVPPANHPGQPGIGQTFVLSNSPPGPNDGTYTITGVDNAGRIARLRTANPIQTFSLANGADVAVTLLDGNGKQSAAGMLTGIMATDYRGQAGMEADDPQAAAQAAGGAWSIASFAKHLQSWLRSQGLAAASAGLDGDGRMRISLGAGGKAALAFRDQISGEPGAEAQDATVLFDVDGDSTPDLAVQGFSAFFGFNDVFVDTRPAAVIDSAIQSSNVAVPTTALPRTLSLSDPSGQLGSTMTITGGATMQGVATQINAATRTTESALQAQAAFTLDSPATITIADANGPVVSRTFGPGPVTLHEIATGLNQATLTARVIRDGAQYRLRLADSRGAVLTAAVEGGTLAGGKASLGGQLALGPAQHVRAAVVPEGSGYRLRLIQTAGRALFAAGSRDATGASVAATLGLQPATTGQSGTIAVRADLQANPAKAPRGAVQWNPELGQYALPPGDSSAARQLAEAMTIKLDMPAAGQLPAGSYSVAEYAATTMATASGGAIAVRSQQNYQATLRDSLEHQYAATGGLTLDGAVETMIDLQRTWASTTRLTDALGSMFRSLDQADAARRAADAASLAEPEDLPDAAEAA